ncbi:MAG: hypothetical protein WA213_05475 [Terriglobales bacterium]
MRENFAINFPGLLLLTMAGAAGLYLTKEAAGAVVETRKARRDCAISYLLDLNAHG